MGINAQSPIAPLTVGGLVCGKFEILERLKPGGMADVYRVRDITSKRILALKVALVGGDEDLAALAFAREREALNDLHHPNIVKLVDFGRTDGSQPYLLLEWLVGSLGGQLAQGMRWGWEDFYADIGRPLLSALALAHARNIAHRDIKPDNLMFDDFGNIRLTDFGIAKAKSNLGFGRTLRHAGSPPYTPPEADDNTHSFARDTYSWAAVAVSCLTGKTFQNYHELKAALEGMSSEHFPVSDLNRCLSLNPDERPVNGQDLFAAMEEFHRSATQGRPLTISVQIGNKEVQELASSLGDRTYEDVLALLAADLNASLHAYVVVEEEGLVRLIGTSLDMSCKPLERADGFRVSSVRALGLERAEVERRQCPELRGVTVKIAGPLAPLPQGASPRALISRILSEITHKQKEVDRHAKERWFDCWAMVLREKERLQREKRVRIPFRGISRRDGHYVALCDGELDPTELGESLLYRLANGKHLIFSIADVFGDQLVLRLQGQLDSLVPTGAGFLESNYIAQAQPIARQRTALDALRRGWAASPMLPEWLCDPSSAPVPESLGLPPGDEDLNEEKRKLLEKALGVSSFLVVEGPPGTGKTTFIAELVRRYVQLFPKARVLLSSQTHTALDHIIVKLRAKHLDDLIVRVHGDRMEKIDPQVLPLTLEQKTRTWIERVEERARKFIASMAAERGLNHIELEVAVVGEQRHILLLELKQFESRLKQIEEQLQAPVDVPHDASAEEIEVQKTTTLLDERQSVRENIASVRRRMQRAEEKLSAYGDYGRELAAASAEESYEWIRVLSSAHEEGAEFLKSLIQTQLDWFSRLGSSKDFFGAVLGEARVVAGTCVGLGNVSAVGEQVFDLCIVDEVSKATATETLIPMCRSRSWILVGDPKQLPPFSESGERMAIEGFDSDEVNATLLDILSRQLPAECRGKLREQRRMAGGIGTLISEVFYDGELETIRKESDRNPIIRSVFPKSVEWHSTSKLKAQDDELPGHTFRNVTECLLIQKLLIQLNAANRGKAALHVAVISAYSAQVRALDERLRSIPGGLPNLMIEVNTVDAFQGKDADVCVYSVTRSNDRRRLGFQREVRRVNVALSRGKDSLVIVGDDLFCRRIESDNPFLDVLAHILNNASDCGLISYERL